MSINFTGQNLRGYSFRGQNLSSANFSHADIRGADFSHANLKNANFTQVKAGLSKTRSVLLFVLAISLSFLSAVMTGRANFLTASVLNFQSLPGFIGIITFLITTSLLALSIIYKGFTLEGFGNFAIVAVSVVTVAAILAVTISISFSRSLIGSIVISAALAGNIATTSTATVVMTHIFGHLKTFFIVNYFIIILGVSFGNIIGNKITSDIATMSLLIGTIAAFFTVFFSNYIAYRVIKGHENYFLVRQIANPITAKGGTSFRWANLTDANFSQAILNNTDFKNANLTHTNFHLAQYLDRARVGETILSDQKVLALLVTHRGSNLSYNGCNFKGAYLAEADLNDVDLTEADFSDAILFQAWLERANLSKVQALNTNLQQSRLTGACLEAWNIDSTTQLDGIICDYIYLLNNQQERRPNSGNFASGEFTKLFQEYLHTVDLIFANGLDFRAFLTAFKQVQIENEGTELVIRSIENKGDGVIVVKVEAPPTANKAKIHTDLTQNYELAITAIEEKFQAELKSKDEQIAIYRQHQEDLKELTKLLISHSSDLVQQPSKGKLVILKIGQGDLSTGFPVTLQIGVESEPFSVETTGQLAPAPELSMIYNRWQSIYRHLSANYRIEVAQTQKTKVSLSEFWQDCHNFAEDLHKSLNCWLNSEISRPIKEILLQQLTPSDSIRFIWQTRDQPLLRLPLQLWDFFECYPKSELALSLPNYQKIQKTTISPLKMKILAILGSSQGINLQQDRELLQQLPNSSVTFLVEPLRQELNAYLWEQAWDILFFAGHSFQSNELGYIQINQTECLAISQLKNALKKAITQGLKLAIFNSCDGLGLALNLAELNMPQMIVMREPIPDQIAQEFLKNFLLAFSNGNSFYQSVRDAREKLQGLEEQFPYATWLPVIFQNPAASPLSWSRVT